MVKSILAKSAQKGSLMVEALALLGLITMVTPILYKKAAERTTELQDINVATQMRMISGAIDDYLRDNYKEVGDTYDDDVFKLSDVERAKLAEYLPHGFDLENSKMFDSLDIAVRRREVEDAKGNKHNIYTSAVLAPLRESLTLMRSSKIASMIGANGGIFRDGMLEGVQGAWRADAAGDYKFATEGVKEGSIAVVSSKAIAAASGDVNSDDVLFRNDSNGVAGNTMETTLYMDGNEIKGLTNLIASTSGGNGADANEIVIGKKDESIVDLFVTGSVNIKQALNVDGYTHLKDGLLVDGDTALHNVSIEGDLMQSGGDVFFDANSITMTSRDPIILDTESHIALLAKGKVGISGDQGVDIVSRDYVNVNAKNVKVEALDELLLKGGETVRIQQGGTDRIVLDRDGNTIYGDTTFKDGNVIIEKNLVVNENIVVGGDVMVEGDVVLTKPDDEETKVMSDWLYANKGIKVGGQNIYTQTSPGDYFTASVDGVNVKSGALNVRDNFYVTDKQFSVGGDLNAEGNMINIVNSGGIKSNALKAFFGYSYSSDSTKRKGFYSDSSSNTLSMYGDKGRTLFNQTYSNVMIEAYDQDGIQRGRIGVNNAGAVNMVSKRVGEDGTAKEGSSILANNRGITLKVADQEGSNKSILIDEYGLAINSSAKNLMDNVHSIKPIDDTNQVSILQTFTPVAIGRQGIIEVAPPQKDQPGGYIKARRLVSDVKYPSNSAFHGFDYAGGELEKPYDYYQVNPAYTSVMNDIKLATRGGARLSDILPDYINKGIYVVDNTYATNNAIKNGWEGVTKEQLLNSPPTELLTSGGAINNTKIASPWLGLVPAPQCPKGYAQVVTLNPIRWRMSEVYSVYDLDNAADYATAIQGVNSSRQDKAEEFKKYFTVATNPQFAEFTLANNGGDAHTHMVTKGRPLTFQTNTWLNTTISEAYMNNSGNSYDFEGWHAIMGFIYRPTQYASLLQDIGVTPDNSKVYWNIFPVYAGDMAGLASVYCYFDRGEKNNWRWGNPVAEYDQLSQFQYGYNKTSAWADSVNDPALGYDDAW